MASHLRTVFRWGIISTGGIATKFVQVISSLHTVFRLRVAELSTGPFSRPKDVSTRSTSQINTIFMFYSRNVHDVVHKVAAVGSRKIESAQDFINNVAGGDRSIKAYGSYEEVYVDKVSSKHHRSL